MRSTQLGGSWAAPAGGGGPPIERVEARLERVGSRGQPNQHNANSLRKFIAGAAAV
jgi:hypothetical protein